MGLRVERYDVRVPDDFDGAVELGVRAGAQTLIPLTDGLLTNHPKRLADLALKHRLPSLYDWREFANAGGLLSFGPSVVGINRQAAVLVDRILKGANPADLPVEQPDTLDLVVNLKTAEALGLEVPSSMLLQATDILR